MSESAPARPDLLVVVLNWNSIDATLTCLESLQAQLDVAFDVLVVDNHSVPDPTTRIRHHFPKNRVMRTERNLGVAGGRNVGLRAALEEGRKYVFFLDNDATIAPHALCELRDAAEAEPRAGALGPLILTSEHPGVIWKAGCTSWRWTYLHAGSEIVQRLSRRTGTRLPAWLDHGRGQGEVDRDQFQAGEVALVTGGAQFVRCEAVREVGLLDEEFAPYGSEDIDFCARLTEAGWTIHFVPTARVWHPETGGFRDEYARAFQNSRNVLLLARKHLGAAYFYGVFLPDHLALMLPMKLGNALSRGAFERARGIVDGVAWNIRDAARRGVRLKWRA